jgi:hypothetical protein
VLGPGIRESDLEHIRRQLGWIGAVLLFLIIPAKALRWTDVPFVNMTLIGIAPSLLGPAGLLFLVLSSSGRRARLTVVQTTILVAAISFGLEFAQLLPRPGILASAKYSFDWLDVGATFLSIFIGYSLARLLAKGKQ